MAKGKVGSSIREVLHLFFISDKSCGGCRELADEMDKITPDEVEKDLEKWVVRMREESIKKWRKSTGYPVPIPPDFTIRKLIQYAIVKAR